MDLVRAPNTNQAIQPLSTDLNTFVEFLSGLIMICEKMKVDIQTTKCDLRRLEGVAKETKRKAVENRVALACANLGFGVAAAAACIFSGGSTLPILFGTAQTITSICSNEVKNEYETNIERVVAAVDDRSKQCKQGARMVINKKKTYETTLNKLMNTGIEERTAVFYTMCAMINELRQGSENGTFITSGERRMIPLGVQQRNLIERVGDKKEVALTGVSLLSLQKMAPEWGVSLHSLQKVTPEWLVNATKLIKDSIPDMAPKLLGAATTILTASAEICSAARFAFSENEATEIIDETIALLTEGESSLDFFITQFTMVRVESSIKLTYQLEIEKREAQLQLEIEKKEILLLQSQQKLMTNSFIIPLIGAIICVLLSVILMKIL